MRKELKRIRDKLLEGVDAGDLIYIKFQINRLDTILNEAESVREETIKEVQTELLKHLYLMKHKNGYPSMAVPKATVLMIDKLMKDPK